MSQSNIDLHQAIEPWVVLASTVLITCCCTKGYTAIDLLKAPLRYRGEVSNGQVQIAVPKGFPITDAILVSSGMEFLSKVKDLNLPMSTQELNEKADVIAIKTEGVGVLQSLQHLDLTYYPFYRFHSEHHFFHADNQVATYIGDCIRFNLLRSGYNPEVIHEGDQCVVMSGSGVQFTVEGMQSLKRIEVTEGNQKTVIDVANRGMEIAANMYPAAYAAGVEMEATGGELANMSTKVTDKTFSLRESPENESV